MAHPGKHLSSIVASIATLLSLSGCLMLDDGGEALSPGGESANRLVLSLRGSTTSVRDVAPRIAVTRTADGLLRLWVSHVDSGRPDWADDEVSLNLIVDLDTPALEAGTSYVLDGAGAIDTVNSHGRISSSSPWPSGDMPSFTPSATADPRVRMVAFFFGCYCDQVDHSEVATTGVLQIDSVDGDTVTGTLHLEQRGRIQGYSLNPAAEMIADAAFESVPYTP